jgi:hypothetical protein
MSGLWINQILFLIAVMSMFKLLLKYCPEDKAAKKQGLQKRADEDADGKVLESKKPIAVKNGINHIALYPIKVAGEQAWKYGSSFKVEAETRRLEAAQASRLVGPRFGERAPGKSVLNIEVLANQS